MALELLRDYGAQGGKSLFPRSLFDVFQREENRRELPL